MAESELDLVANPQLEREPPRKTPKPLDPEQNPAVSVKTFDPNPEREKTRGDLARGLLWLLTFVVGGVLVFIALGRLEGTVLTQSIFPSLIALAGTALGFYFGSQNPLTGVSATGGQSSPPSAPEQLPDSNSPTPRVPPATDKPPVSSPPDQPPLSSPPD